MSTLCRRVWVLPLVASALVGQQYPFVHVNNSPRNIERIIQDKQWSVQFEELKAAKIELGETIRKQLALDPHLGEENFLYRHTSPLYPMNLRQVQPLLHQPLNEPYQRVIIVRFHAQVEQLAQQFLASRSWKQNRAVLDVRRADLEPRRSCKVLRQVICKVTGTARQCFRIAQHKGGYVVVNG